MQVMQDAPWIVIKFGGTSVASPEAWRQILSITRRHLEQGKRPLLVCSALSGISNQLEQAYELAVRGQEYQPVYRSIVKQHRQLCEALRLPLPREAESLIWKLRKQLVNCGIGLIFQPACKAKVMAIGELLTTVIGQAWLKVQGLDLNWLDARNLLLCSDLETSSRHYLSARCQSDFDPALSAQLAEHSANGAITQGFIARDTLGETVLLGRGGSDTSAAYLASRLGASALEIWTDVPGLFTANPHEVPTALLLPQLNYDIAELMAYRGAKVLHPRCLEPLRQANIPLRVCSTRQPEFAGTLITANVQIPQTHIYAILSRQNLTRLSFKRDGILLRDDFLQEAIETAFNSQLIGPSSIYLNAEQAEIILDSALDNPDPERITSAIEHLENLITYISTEQVSSVSLIGQGLNEDAGLSEKLQQWATDGLISPSRHELTVIVQPEQTHALVQILHQHLFYSGSLNYPEDFGPSWDAFNQPINAIAS